VRHTPPQQSLAREARRRNVRGAFGVSGDVRGARLVVVDDVMTTGSTLNEIADTLKRAGAARVVNRVVARTP
jgi:predicted amidophosphoribosyltransferase